MQTIDFKAEARSQVGKGSARAARRAGLVPAVIYGNKQSPIAITLDANKWRQFCLLYTSPSPRDQLTSRMPSSA